MKREQTTIRLPANLKEQLYKEADKKGLTFNQLILIIIDRYIANHQK